MSTNGTPRGGGRGGKSGGRGPLPRSTQVSKKIAKLLRHSAEEEGLQLDSSGYANLKDVLNNRNVRSLKVTFAEVRQIVEENDKQRFSLVPVGDAATDGESANGTSQPTVPSEDPRDWLIRANQGHSLKIESESLLQPITRENFPETAVHGTTHAAWPLILASGGLKPMTRTHVHFASGLPATFKSVVDLESDTIAAPPVISGMRNSSTVLMFLDVYKAIDAGLKLWRSDNGVILTEGNEHGVVPMELFKRVEDRTGAGVLLENGVVVKEAPAGWSKGKGKG